MQFLNYFKALRMPFITASSINFIIFWLTFSKDFNTLFFLGFFGIILAHLSGNLWNDYFDFDSDSINQKPTPFSGGSRFLQNKIISKKNFFIFSLIISFLALITGALIFTKLNQGHFFFLILIAVSILLTFFYTAPPIKLVYRGLGEIAIILTFGPLIALGISLMLSIPIQLNQILLSLVFGILTARILFINQILDYQPDKDSGKRTLANLIPSHLVRYTIFIFSLVSVFLLLLIHANWIFFVSSGILLISELLILIVPQPLLWAFLGMSNQFIIGILWIIFLSNGHTL